MPNEQNDVRGDLLALLLAKVEQDQYPSSTMMDMIEEILTPDELSRYAHVLLDKIRGDQFPSLDMMRRLMELV
jgi:hypothetical protein